MGDCRKRGCPKGNSSISSAEVRIFGRQICAGLLHVHSRTSTSGGKQLAHLGGIVFCDLKPGNVLFNEEEVLKPLRQACSSLQLTSKLRLGHFSQALPVEKASTERRGTPQYMAPELLCELAERTGHSFLSDLWSLGCLLHELFMGQVPFASASSLQLQRLVLEAPPKMHGATMDFQDRWLS